MAPPLFALHHRKNPDMLEAVVTGYWSTETVSAFAIAVNQAIDHAALSRSGSRRLPMLIDARDHGVQGSEVATALESVARALAKRLGRLAVVVGTTLHKLQSQRINPSADHRTFQSREEAVAWLNAA